MLYEVITDIVIEPKMSFGTGHHETTKMMVQHILKNDFTNKSVLDMGCGTGILAIVITSYSIHYTKLYDPC